MQAECGRGWGLILPLPLPSPLPSQSCGCCCRCHRRCCRRCRRCCCCSAAAAANCCCLATTSCYWLLQWADLQRCHIQQGASSRGGSSGGHSVEGNGPSGHCRSRDGQQVQIDHQRAQECRPPRAMGGGLGWAWVAFGCVWTMAGSNETNGRGTAFILASLRHRVHTACSSVYISRSNNVS